jgi:hypothetical protein
MYPSSSKRGVREKKQRPGVHDPHDENAAAQRRVSVSKTPVPRNHQSNLRKPRLESLLEYWVIVKSGELGYNGAKRGTSQTDRQTADRDGAHGESSHGWMALRRGKGA